MRKFFYGLLVALFIFAGLAAVALQTDKPARAQSIPATWSELKLCWAGYCVPHVCPANCKDE